MRWNRFRSNDARLSNPACWCSNEQPWNYGRLQSPIRSARSCTETFASTLTRDIDDDIHDYLLIEQLLREYVRDVDWIHGGGCHPIRGIGYSFSVRLFVVEKYMTMRLRMIKRRVGNRRGRTGVEGEGREERKKQRKRRMRGEGGEGIGNGKIRRSKVMKSKWYISVDRSFVGSFGRRCALRSSPSPTISLPSFTSPPLYPYATLVRSFLLT